MVSNCAAEPPTITQYIKNVDVLCKEFGIREPAFLRNPKLQTRKITEAHPKNFGISAFWRQSAGSTHSSLYRLPPQKVKRD
ncbi:MAG: hypothetical protein RLZZ511_4260 [Cyanobacteriota bacterium]